MKTIQISRRARSITALLNEARDENLVLTLADGSEFILAEIDSFDHEVKLTRPNQPLMELLKQRAQQPKRVALAEAKKRLGVDGQPKTKRANRQRISATPKAAA